jgi:serine/threonine protein kinase
VTNPSIKHKLRNLAGDYSGLHPLGLEYVGFKVIDPTLDMGLRHRRLVCGDLSFAWDEIASASHMSSNLSETLTLDGYRMVRFLGRGGFGEVWLCRSESMGDFRALKFIPDGDTDRLEKEYQALLHYRKAAARLRSSHLVPIEHVNRNDAGLYYVMPLADGTGADDPADPAWQPTSLATLIHDRSNAAAWFSSREIISLLLPVLEALQTLSDAGLVHRDVKPENILLFGGQPCLGDISLLGADASVITRRGTPGYGTPSWYVGGHPDMYGVAATLFTLLTGNLPDRMGRAAFLWPPQGESSMSPDEKAEWKRLHAVIRRATEESVGERFLDFRAMGRALQGSPSESPPRPDPSEGNTAKSAPKKKRSSSPVMVTVGVMLFGLWLFGFLVTPPADSDPSRDHPQETTSEIDRSSVAPDESTAAKQFKIVDADGRFESNRQKIIDQLGIILSQPPTGQAAPKRLDPTAYARSSAVMRSFKARDYSACLEALEAKHASDGDKAPEPEAILFRCLLLNKLGRTDEAEIEIIKLNNRPTDTVTDQANFMLRLAARLVLWEALGGCEQGAKLASYTITTVLSNPDNWPPGTLENLFQLRARMRVLMGDFPSALADEKAAIALPLHHTAVGATYKALNQTEAQARQSHLNTMVMQWDLLEQEFPEYGQYLVSNGSPEPQPDRRDLRDED